MTILEVGQPGFWTILKLKIRRGNKCESKVYIHVCVCVCVHVYVCLHVCMCVFACVQVYMHACAESRRLRLEGCDSCDIPRCM